MKRFSLILCLALLAGCTLPQTVVMTGAAAPSFILKGAPDGAAVYVDGLSRGDAKQFDGNPKVLAVLEGVHTVEVRQGTAVLYVEKVFVSNGESRTVIVATGAAR